VFKLPEKEIAFSVGLIILLTGKSYVQITLKGLFRLSKENVKKLSMIGLPTGLEMFFRQGSQFLLLKIVSLYGTPALATFGIGMRLSNLVFLPLLGLSMGGSTIAGQNLGANQVDRTHKTALWAAFLGSIVTGLIVTVLVIFPEYIIRLFINQNEVVEIGKNMINIIAPSFIIIAISMGLNTVFSGSGFNLPFLVSGIVSRWLFQIPFSLLIVYTFYLSINYIWVGFLLAEIIELIVMIIYYKKGRWKYNRV